MDRRTFLKRGAGAAVGVALLPYIPELAEPVAEDAAVALEFCSVRVTQLTAAGGICAPVAPYYTLPALALDVRPVRDALPAFTASRGGVALPDRVC